MTLEEKITKAVDEHAAEIEEKRQKLLMLVGQIQAFQSLMEEEATTNGMLPEAVEVS